MAGCAPAQGRSAPDLREILPYLGEITDAYHLGVHLGVPAEKLKEFERDHPRDVARQRTEAVSYWRNNCDNATWDGLAEAVEKLGGHGNLVKKLRKRAQETCTPLEELNSPLKLKWRRGEDMPYEMTGPVQAIVIGDNVYVGGGVTAQNPVIVMVYSLQTRSWTTLPPHESFWFGMASVNDQLVLVGGSMLTGGEATNVLVVWDERSQTWTRPFPVMPTARSSPSVISYQKWLVVAGGADEINSGVSKVELLDTLSRQWYEGSSLPAKRFSMSSAINGDTWYLSGGFSSPGLVYKDVFSACLDKLISQAVSQSASSTSSPWQTLPEAPLKRSTVLILNGALLTVGGEGSSSIHLYQPGGRSWVKVGDLPGQRQQCASTVLPNGEVFAVGGNDGIGFSNTVYIAIIV